MYPGWSYGCMPILLRDQCLVYQCPQFLVVIDPVGGDQLSEVDDDKILFRVDPVRGMIGTAPSVFSFLSRNAPCSKVLYDGKPQTESDSFSPWENDIPQVVDGHQLHGFP